TVVMAIVVPAVIMPLMLYGQKYSAGRREQLLSTTTYRYAVTGPLADRVRGLIDQTRKILNDSSDKESEKLKQFKFVEVPVADVKESLANGDIHFYLDTMTGEEADKLPAKNESGSRRATNASRSVAATRRLEGVPLCTVVYRADRDASDNAQDQMLVLLRIARQHDSQLSLIEHGFAGDPKQLFPLEDSSIATHGQVTGSLVGRFITLFLV